MRFVHGHAPRAHSDVLSTRAQAFSGALNAARALAPSYDAVASIASRSVALESVAGIDNLRNAAQSAMHLPAALQPAALRQQGVRSRIRAFCQCQPGNTISGDILAEIARILAELERILARVPDPIPPINTGLGRLSAGILTPDEALRRLHMGVMIELSTIPLYNYAMCSVRPQPCDGVQVRALVRGVLQQEMLHLSLAGNIYTALGGPNSLTLYDPRIVPMYPMEVLYSRIPMNLQALGSDSLQNFIRIEAAAPADDPPPADEYRSIGELYEDVYTRIRELDDKEFARNVDNQFVGQDFFDEQLFAITDRNTAHRAIVRIIEQGEGNLRVPDSHHEIFTILLSGTGSTTLTWETYNVPTNPQTEDYEGNEFVYALSLSADAAYCYLLQTIQRVWQLNDISTRLLLLRNTHGIMNDVLTPLAELLIQQPFGTGCAAPCFNYYPMVNSTALDPLEPRQLHAALVLEVNNAACLAGDDNTRTTLERLACYINNNLGPFTQSG